MLTVRATLQPNGQVQLPPALANGKAVPVLVTILEPPPHDGPSPSDEEAVVEGRSSVAGLRALLESPAFLALPPSDPQEVEARIQSIRAYWDGE
jgi:hypothetical protein